MKTKIKKIAAGILGVILLLFLLSFLNSMVGNPISNFMAKKATEKYIVKTYPELSLEIDKVFYNFKVGNYGVVCKSPYSIDTVFSVYADSFGRIKYDDYEFEVENKMTTFRRLDNQMREYGKKLFTENFPEYNINLAILSLNADDSNINNLIHDTPLDIHNPPIPVEAALWIYDKDLSFNKMAEMLIKMENILKKENIPVSFYNVRIENVKTKISDGVELKDNQNLWLYDIPVKLLDDKENLPANLEKMYNERNN